jgi:hypothetical protein
MTAQEIIDLLSEAADALDEPLKTKLLDAIPKIEIADAARRAAARGVAETFKRYTALQGERASTIQELVKGQAIKLIRTKPRYDAELAIQRIDVLRGT